MKKITFLATLISVLILSCQHEEQIDKKTNHDHQVKVTIVNETPLEEHGGRTVYLTGGKAEGNGWYDPNDYVRVSATPDPGYEIEYFYGGPVHDPRRFDYERDGRASYTPDLIDGNHYFKVKFRKIIYPLDQKLIDIVVGEPADFEHGEGGHMTGNLVTLTCDEKGKVKHRSDPNDGLYTIYYAPANGYPWAFVNLHEGVEILGWATSEADAADGNYIQTADMTILGDLDFEFFEETGVTTVYCVVQTDRVIPPHTPQTYTVYLEKIRKGNQTGPYNGVPIDYISNVHWPENHKYDLSWNYEYRLTSDDNSNCGILKLYQGSTPGQLYVEINRNWYPLPDEEFILDEWSGNYDNFPISYHCAQWVVNGNEWSISDALISNKGNYTGELFTEKINFTFQADNGDTYILKGR